jgi:hypothetical protein
LRFFLLKAGLANDASLGDYETEGKAAAEAAALCVKSNFDPRQLYHATGTDPENRPGGKNPAES